MTDRGSSVTLILYSLDPDWYKGTEPFLNLLAAAAQRSSFTHVELAIGEGAGQHGEMVNVLRIFNDATGAELTQRTGKNPNYQYLQIGCSQKATAAMMQFARAQVGKPFSSAGMAWSMISPRTSTGADWYCAELVAACLKVGGLMSSDSNPGGATPSSLYKLYKTQGAMMANPCTLRQQFGASSTRSLAFTGLKAEQTRVVGNTSCNPHDAARSGVARGHANLPTHAQGARAPPTTRYRSDSPPRMRLKVLQQRGANESRSVGAISLSLTSLNMDRRQ